MLKHMNDSVTEMAKPPKMFVAVRHLKGYGPEFHNQSSDLNTYMHATVHEISFHGT